MKNTMLRKSFKMPEKIDNFNGYTVPEIAQPYASSVQTKFLEILQYPSLLILPIMLRIRNHHIQSSYRIFYY